MRKLLLVFLVIPFCSSYGQSIFKTVNNKFGMGIHCGVGCLFQDYSMFFYAFDFTVCGFYIDGGGHSRSHRRDVEIDKWNDKRAWFFHGGYQLPISKSIRIIPMLGYVNADRGTTDGSNWKISDSGIENKYHEIDEKKGLDFGGQIVYARKNLTLKATCTKFMLMAGIGFEL